MDPSHRRRLEDLVWAVTGLLALLLANTQATAQEAFARRPVLHHVEDLAGRKVDPFEIRDKKGIVFLFVRPDCPISNRYSPEIRRLQEKFDDIAFWLIYADADLTSESIQRHRWEYSLQAPALRDRKHELVRLCDARVTPEAAVFTPEYQLVYRGRIDDRYVDFGKYRAAPTKRDLEEILDKVAAGRPLQFSTTMAVGCSISSMAR